MVAAVDDATNIPRFFAGRSVLITGGTGFMGKVLIERLLSTCPELHRIYLLVRNKKDHTPEDRLQQLKQCQVFDVVRESNPAQLEKLAVLPGDMTQPTLGLSTDSLKQLNEVSVVWHMAATVRFDEPLQVAVQMNVRATMLMLELCDTLDNIQAFIHVSTAYSNTDKDVVEERVYPPPVELEDLLSITKCLPTDLLASITPEYIKPRPNTYTFTKAMAEAAIVGHSPRKYPIAIFRPTIVVSALRHPFPGWVENLNGPSGMMVAAGKGLLHVFRYRMDCHPDLLPVDIAIDTLIAVAWETAIDKPMDVNVYNCSMTENMTSWRYFITEFEKNIRLFPMNDTLWHPCAFLTENELTKNTFEIFFQTLPMHIAGYFVKFFGIKTRLSLISVSEKLHKMMSSLEFFTTNDWEFKNQRVQHLRERLSKQDAAIYNLDPRTVDWSEHLFDFMMGVKKYILKEKEQDLMSAKRHIRRLYYLHTFLKLFLIMLVFRLFLKIEFVHNFVYGSLNLIMYVCRIVFNYETSPIETNVDLIR